MTTYLKVTSNNGHVQLLDVYHVNPMSTNEILEKLGITYNGEMDEDISAIEKIRIDEIRQTSIIG